MQRIPGIAFHSGDWLICKAKNENMTPQTIATWSHWYTAQLYKKQLDCSFDAPNLDISMYSLRLVSIQNLSVITVQVYKLVHAAFYLPEINTLTCLSLLCRSTLQ